MDDEIVKENNCTKLQAFLRESATSFVDESEDSFGSRVTYTEDVNADAINGDDWLDAGTTYIWKAATLAVVDANKSDWARLYIGHQRSPSSAPELIGVLHWREGENDDIAQSLHRYIEKCLPIDPLWMRD